MERKNHRTWPCPSINHPWLQQHNAKFTAFLKISAANVHSQQAFQKWGLRWECRSDTWRPICSKYTVLHKLNFSLDIGFSFLYCTTSSCCTLTSRYFSSEVMTACKFRSTDNTVHRYVGHHVNTPNTVFWLQLMLCQWSGIINFPKYDSDTDDILKNWNGTDFCKNCCYHFCTALKKFTKILHEWQKFRQTAVALQCTVSY